jgi:hypothetical protein
MPLEPMMPDILASRRPAEVRYKLRLNVRFAAAAGIVVSAALAFSAPGIAASFHGFASTAGSRQGQGVTSRWLDSCPEKRPTAGSPAAFRLAEQRDSVRCLNTQPGLDPTPGSAAAFRLADQRASAAFQD